MAGFSFCPVTLPLDNLKATFEDVADWCISKASTEERSA
jgi:hypothetical protein